MSNLSWGVLGASLFAIEHMIPALQETPGITVDAIASREKAKADAVAGQFGLPKAYGDYESLLADPDIDVIFNPLPNHLHVPWTAKAARAGKHVLCEKPLALDAAEAETLIAVRDETGVQIQEGYCVRHHTQWRRVRELVRAGRIGDVRAIQGWFSYNLNDPDNIRNKREMGGGGLYDVGVYPLVTARFVFEADPLRAFAFIERDPVHDVDTLTSAILEFPTGILSFTCATRLSVHQHMAIHGTKARMELADPFAQAPDREARISILGDREIWDPPNADIETVDRVNQYVPQAAAFCAAVRGETPLEFPLEDSVKIMRALDALFLSAETGRWEDVGA
jgi:predicted dehydrogenase